MEGVAQNTARSRETNAFYGLPFLASPSTSKRPRGRDVTMTSVIGSVNRGGRSQLAVGLTASVLARDADQTHVTYDDKQKWQRFQHERLPPEFIPSQQTKCL